MLIFFIRLGYKDQDIKTVKSKVKIGNWWSLQWRQDSLSFLHSF